MLVIPYTPDLFVDAINLGQPVVFGRPNEPVCEMFQYFAGQISKPEHQVTAPAAVTSTWQQIARRLLG
ncbi:hypothetical protein ATHL_00490 [Anaerolinea thermolimosa]|nr:hypothetical protein ATHL_00490 [Anaerolinea thermolimosa]